jgi:predicted nuclease of restriction endonuclease-like (RecB) superfamily
MPAWYPAFLEAVTAHLAAEREPLLTHWSIGRELLHWQQEPDWTHRCIVHLSTDLTARFPAHKGLSVRNLIYMRAFAEAWPHEAYARGPLAELPWYHHLTLLQLLDSLTLRLWYAREALDHNWTRATLTTHITNNLYGQTHNRRRSKPTSKD